jgi:hypothetical protein
VLIFLPFTPVNRGALIPVPVPEVGAMNVEAVFFSLDYALDNAVPVDKSTDLVLGRRHDALPYTWSHDS